MKNLYLKSTLLIVIMCQLLSVDVFGFSHIIVNVPKDSLHQYYDVCTSSQYFIRVNYFYDTAGTKYIFIPHGACIKDSDSTDPNPALLMTTADSLFDKYSVVLNGTSPFNFFIDLTSIDCQFYGNQSSQPRIVVKDSSGANIVEGIIDINRPDIRFTGSNTVIYQKGTAHTRTYDLRAVNDADYDQFKIQASVEQEIFITNLSVCYFDSLGNAVGDTIDFALDTIKCSDIPDSTTAYLNTTVRSYSIVFMKGNISNKDTVPLPSNFGPGWKARVKETFTVISVSNINFTQQRTGYGIYSSLCNNQNADICGTNTFDCPLYHSGDTNNVVRPDQGDCMMFFAGDSPTDSVHTFIDVYNSNNTQFDFSVLNDSPDPMRFYGLRFIVNSNNFFIPDTNIVVGWLLPNGNFQSLSPQPNIAIRRDSGVDFIDICFKDFIGTDPDGSGPLYNAYPNPADTLAAHQYYCDLPSDDSLIVRFSRIQFIEDGSMHDCNIDPLSFIIHAIADVRRMNDVDLCLGDGRQIRPLGGFDKCDTVNMEIEVNNSNGYGGIISGDVENNTVNGAFAGDVSHTSSNTDIVQATDPYGHDTTVVLTYVFNQTNGTTPWELAGPQRGCGSYTTSRSGILTQYGETFYAHVEIPTGFKIVPQDTMTYFAVTDSAGIPDTVRYYNIPLTYNSHHCNSYNLLLPEANCSISFSVRMDGCPPSDTCECSTTITTNHFGIANFCLQFRSQLNDSSHAQSQTIDSTLKYIAYGCEKIPLFYHCTGECDGLVTSIKDFKFERNTFGWTSDSTYLAGLPPDTVSGSGIGKHRVYINDDILAVSHGAITKNTDTCLSRLNFEFTYPMVGIDTTIRDTNLFVFDSTTVVLIGTGVDTFHVRSFVLNASNKDSVWYMLTNNPQGNQNDTSYLAVSMDLNHMYSTDSLGNIIDTLQNIVHSNVNEIILFTGHYHVDCSNATILPPGHYFNPQIRAQFTMHDPNAPTSCYTHCCDPWGAAMDALIIENTVGESFTTDPSNYPASKRCALPFSITVNTTGGYTAPIDDFPNEYRPLVEFPDTFSFHISNNLFLSRAAIENKITAPNPQTTFHAFYYDISGDSIRPQSLDCPGNLVGGGDPLHPGGTLHFGFNYPSRTMTVNQNGSESDTISIGSMIDIKAQAKNFEHTFTFDLTRNCLGISEVFKIDSIHFPMTFLHSYYRPNSKTDTFPKCSIADTLLQSSATLTNSDISFINNFHLVPQGLSGNIYYPTGNILTFCAVFDSLESRTGWIYCPDTNISILSIEKANNNCQSTGRFMTINSTNNLFYFNHEIDHSPQYLSIKAFVPCHGNGGSNGYDSIPMHLNYGVFCNRCALDTIDPMSGDSAVLTSCGIIKKLGFEVLPQAPSVAIHVMVTHDTMSFCNPDTLVITYQYPSTSGVPTATQLNIINSSFTTPGSYFWIVDSPLTYQVYNTGDTLSYPFTIPDALEHTFKFIYLPACSLFNDSSQSFYLEIAGYNGCGDSIKFPLKKEGLDATAEPVIVFLPSIDPFISMHQTNFPSTLGCNATIHDTITIIRHGSFSGTVNLSAYLPPHSSFSSPFTNTNTSNSVHWAISANSTSGNDTLRIPYSMQLTGTICSGGYDLTDTVWFDKSCYGGIYCPSAQPHVGHDSIHVNCSSQHVITSPVRDTVCSTIPDTLTVTTCSGCTYQWLENNTLINGATSNYYVAVDTFEILHNWNDATHYYSVLVTNANGCSSLGRDTIVITPAANDTFNLADTNFICQNGSVQLLANADGYYHYLWSTGDTTQNISIHSSGIYSLHVINYWGCVATMSKQITLKIDSLIQINSIVTAPSCYGGTDGSISYTITGGTHPYSVLWQSLDGLDIHPGQVSAGSYVVTITDSLLSHGCALTDTITVGDGNPNCCGTYPNKLTQNKINSFGNGDTIRGYWDLDSSIYIQNNLMFLDDTIAIAQNVNIVIMGGASVTIDNSLLYACKDMWQGIYVQASGTLTIINSVIRDAINAVYSNQSNANINIQKSHLIENYVGVNLTDGDYPALSIFGSEIIGNTLTKAPYAGQRAFAGIELTNVYGDTIGDSKQDANSIESLDFGIYAVSSGLRVINTNFKNIITSCDSMNECDYNGYAIYNTGINDWTNQGLVVGGSNANEPCTFINCTNGVYSYFSPGTSITNNNFIIDYATYSGTSNTSAVNLFKHNGTNKDVDVLANHFENYRTGIEVDQMASINISINDNYFNQYNQSHYAAGTDAIKVRNTTHLTSPTVDVQGNKIFKFKHGILFDNIQYSTIKAGNSIYLDISSPGYGQTYYGIKSTNGYNNIIEGNGVTRLIGVDPDAATENRIYGVRIESGVNNTISGNHTSKTGTGIRFFNCITSPNTVICNQLENCISGITIEHSDIGSQGTSSTASDNFWTMLPNRHANIFLNPGPTSPVIWFLQIGVAGYDPDPNPLTCSNCIVPGFSILESSAPTDSNCSAPCNDLPCIQNKLYQIANELGAYSNLDDYGKYVSKKYAFYQLKDNPDLMNLKTEMDSVLINFFDSLRNTNIDALNHIDSLILVGDTAQAIIENTSISPENLDETNATLVNDIYIKTWAPDEIPPFDEDQTNTLLNIAYQNPISGGNAVYDARVMLGLDMDDYYMDENARLPERKPDQNDLPFGKIIPNPNNGTMKFVYKLNEDENGSLEIFNVKGQKLKFYELQKETSEQEIDMNSADCGIYFCRFTVNDQIVLSAKIVIEK